MLVISKFLNINLQSLTNNNFHRNKKVLPMHVQDTEKPIVGKTKKKILLPNNLKGLK